MHNIYVIELKKLTEVTPRLLDALTFNQIPVNWGIKRDGYYIMNLLKNRWVNNFEDSYEVRYFNTFMQICINKGYSLIMIKF